MSRIAIVANPISGSGRSKAETVRLQLALEAAGHIAEVTWSLPGEAKEWLDPALEGVDVVLVVSGDGGVRQVAEGAIRTGTPLYHVPAGTENLFARTMGMTGKHQAILDAIKEDRVRKLDIASANGQTCILMASCGFDAAVVHDLARRRAGPIFHWSYLPCMLRQLWRWRPVPTTIMVDGTSIGTGGPGLCFVCNSREYGARFNPAPEASMEDGLLDIVFLPVRGRLDLLRWMNRARRCRHLDVPGVLHVQGKIVVLEPSSPAPWQVDGDCPPETASPCTRRIAVQVRPGALPVLHPA